MSVTPFDELCNLARQAALLESIESALGWDERTHMPPAAGEYRAEQMTYVSGLVHRRRTDPRLGELLAAIGRQPARGRSAQRHRQRSSARCAAITTSTSSCRNRWSRS